jgi:uncharacterized membrane protein YfcA
VREVQPLSLILNGITALFSLFGYTKGGLVQWRPAILLAGVTTISAPFGSWLAQHADARWLWAFYFAAVAFLAWPMFLPDKAGATVSPKMSPRAAGWPMTRAPRRMMSLKRRSAG